MSFKYKILMVIAPSIFILDQLSKWFIQTYLKIGDFIPVVPGYFDIVHVVNKGAAFGMFASTGEDFRVPFFYIVSLIAVIVIAGIYVKIPPSEKLMPVIFSLILGGIAGNVMDRLRFGRVTDFLSFHVGDKVVDRIIGSYHIYFRLEWPAFNVADSAITVAMILLIWSLLRPYKGEVS